VFPKGQAGVPRQSEDRRRRPQLNPGAPIRIAANAARRPCAWFEPQVRAERRDLHTHHPV
jgi:hypothetical protein